MVENPSDIFLTEITFLIFCQWNSYYSSIHKETKHFFERYGLFGHNTDDYSYRWLLNMQKEIYRKFQVNWTMNFTYIGMFLVVNEQVPKYRKPLGASLMMPLVFLNFRGVLLWSVEITDCLLPSPAILQILPLLFLLPLSSLCFLDVLL